MIKDVLRQLDYSLTAQISLLMFFTIFIVVSIRTLLQDRNTSQEQANAIFDEKVKETGHE